MAEGRLGLCAPDAAPVQAFTWRTWNRTTALYRGISSVGVCRVTVGLRRLCSRPWAAAASRLRLECSCPKCTRKRR